MTVFWILSAGLMGLALLFVLPPLLSKRAQVDDVDQDELNLAVFRQQLRELDADLAAEKLDRHQYRAARRDLERELLHDVGEAGTKNARDAAGGRWVGALLGLAVPAAAISLYLYLGDSSSIARLQAATTGQAPAAQAGSGGDVPPLDVMVQRLAAKLEQNPDNLEGWTMLGRTYFAIGKPERALHALEKAYGLAPENPDVLVTYAEAVAANNDGSLVGRPAELIRAAIKIDPQHASARWLDGLVSFQDAKYVQAAEQWGTLAATFDPQSEEAAELKRYIAEARSLAGLEPEQVSDATEDADPGQGTAQAAGDTAAGDTGPAPPPAAAAAGVTVEVSLAEPLWREADVNDSVFVYAKAVSGPPMPLAAHRARVADLPLRVTLNDSMAMIPAMKLSGFDAVTVGARISQSGQALPQRGDLEGEVSPVKVEQAGVVKVLIDRVRH